MTAKAVAQMPHHKEMDSVMMITTCAIVTGMVVIAVGLITFTFIVITVCVMILHSKTYIVVAQDARMWSGTEMDFVTTETTFAIVIGMVVIAVVTKTISTFVMIVNAWIRPTKAVRRAAMVTASSPTTWVMDFAMMKTITVDVTGTTVTAAATQTVMHIVMTASAWTRMTQIH